ncbi:uncharacterized protein BDZ99DRAFT_438623 [Mytilinidion resinicola]|uniref:Zn(2)-C6 fungal-type domain-containing protein n=1 Tax=Mytilinidion resinicola TaxID=574789 RepID=A0A6A6YXB3_9PEZI|nr:uncharacterized protein BDZ99DRAFT_438623 [Mytilinidion resinicola]KAF2813451.1 hypothetical protein BDZ99DRAFT_438623 [Mytilinidion resinicola]
MVDLTTGKRHAACDKCRTRKLKCSGGLPRCSRCLRENIQCVYSLQKSMGRPRKRRRDESSDQPRPDLERHGSRSGSSATTLHLNSNDSVACNSGGIEGSMTNWFGEPPQVHSRPSSALEWPAMESMLELDGATAVPPDQFPKLSCLCLSTMYLTLSSLQSLPSFSFPVVIPPLRSALASTLQILHCPDCPRETFSGIQNVITLTSLLTAIAERYHRALKAIDEEAEQLEKSGRKKDFRVGEMSVNTLHLHTGEVDCPMGFHIELGAEEWKKLAKKVIKTEVLGKGSSPTPLIEVVEQMEKRQTEWHSRMHEMNPEREKLFGRCNDAHQSGDATCLRMVKQVRMMIDAMNWT